MHQHELRSGAGSRHQQDAPAALMAAGRREVERALMASVGTAAAPLDAAIITAVLCAAPTPLLPPIGTHWSFLEHSLVGHFCFFMFALVVLLTILERKSSWA